MNNQELKLHILKILEANLTSDEFGRVKSITVEDSAETKLVKTNLRAEEIRAKVALAELDIAKSKLAGETKEAMAKYIKQLAEDNLKALADYVGVKSVAVSPTSLSIAQYLFEHGRLTLKQKDSILNYYSVT